MNPELGERGQTGSFPNSETPPMVTSKTNLVKQISENFPSVPNSLSPIPEGVDWNQPGEDEGYRQVCRAILDQQR